MAPECVQFVVRRSAKISANQLHLDIRRGAQVTNAPPPQPPPLSSLRTHQSLLLLAVALPLGALVSGQKPFPDLYLSGVLSIFSIFGIFGIYGLWRSKEEVVEEKLTFFPNVGVQLTTLCRDGRSLDTFIDAQEIRSIFINEAIHMFTVQTYMAIRVCRAASADRYKEELVVCFPRLQPKIPMLQDIYRKAMQLDLPLNKSAADVVRKDLHIEKSKKPAKWSTGKGG